MEGGSDEVEAVVPRAAVASGAATPILARDRESVVMYQMASKEEQFTGRHSVLCLYALNSMYCFS